MNFYKSYILFKHPAKLEDELLNLKQCNLINLIAPEAWLKAS